MQQILLTYLLDKQCQVPANKLRTVLAIIHQNCSFGASKMFCHQGAMWCWRGKEYDFPTPLFKMKTLGKKFEILIS